MIIAVVGAQGKMGKLICNTALQRGHTVICVDKDTPQSTIKDIHCDVVVDFSSPSALPVTKSICIANNAPLVYGTTGTDSKSNKLLKQISKKVKVVARPNFCSSLPAFCTALEKLAQTLNGWDAVIEEHHHKYKKDSPSGTALYIQNVLRRYIPDINIVSIRYGNVIGIHRVIFTNGIETITLTHDVSDRTAFALGSVMCAEQLTK